ncbi:hypothetical protein [Paludisphaera mucosa]|uniref:Uncharacterized protein n=1 Tax=Paludisphaera mucosa TaxID=3030827 RepID=A0ABT6FIN0_9BACT|nr:hypothetical protein [Paludisphaera mucosa]MDG3007441.1 hypothetical protein [Paludisphaera mucosa]
MVVRRLLIAISAWGVLTTSAVTVFILTNETNPDHRAIIKMGVALILIWCVLGGLAMRLLRDRFVRLVTRLPLGWRTRFVVLCIGFALLEEAVTTSLTNLAPLFGAATDAARITASRNYFEVVLLNSVVAFVPMFLAWGWLLSRYDFRPAEVLLLFGLNGTLAETLSFGPHNLIQVGMWVWVYGLMAYLPACTTSEESGARPARWYHGLTAVFLPLVFIVPLMLWLVWKAAATAWKALRSGRGKAGTMS